MDLAGKTTLVRILQTELTRRGIPVRVGRNSLCADNPIAALADQLRRDPEAGLLETGAAFLAAHLWDARHFRPPPDGTIHLQASSWLRTVSYHMVRGTPQIAGLLLEASAAFPTYDRAVFLTADLEERRRRLQQRECDRPGANDRDDHAVIREQALFLRQECIIRRLAERLLKASVIDTTRAKLDEVAEICLMLMHKGETTSGQ
jgi:hypothetical protein